jgi:hypothetical protein
VFRRRPGWRRLRCPGRTIYGYLSPDGKTLEVVCADPRCRRRGQQTRHQFALDSGACVTEYLTPVERDERERDG